MELIVNDRPMTLPEQATVTQLLETLGVTVKHVAVEVNGELVSRSNHPTHALNSGDRVEVVTFVGGG